MMAVHDALHRTVTGRHEGRRDHQVALERMAAEIEARAAQAALAVEPDAVQTAATTTGARDGDST